MLLAALGRENAEYYEGKTRTKQWTQRQKRASENEKASARAQQRGAAVGFHPAPFGYVGTWSVIRRLCLSRDAQSRSSFFFQIAKKSGYLALV